MTTLELADNLNRAKFDKIIQGLRFNTVSKWFLCSGRGHAGLTELCRFLLTQR